MAADTLTFLQQKEIESARKTGISDEHLAICLDNHLNYLQIREVCRAIKDGVDICDIKRAAQAHVSSQDMEELFRCLKNGEEPMIQLSSYREPRRFSRTAKIACCAAGLAILLMFVPQPETETAEVLTLTADEIVLSCGEIFYPEKYILSGTQSGKLKLPSSFHAEKPENRIVLYEQQLGRDIHQVMLRIKIVDQTAPVLKLKKSSLKLLKGICFDPACMIKSAEDNVDGSLLNRVTWIDEDPDSWHDRDIVYEVKDSSGNKTAEILHLSYEETAEEIVETTSSENRGVSPEQDCESPEAVYEPKVTEAEETVTETIVETTVENTGFTETVVEHHVSGAFQ